MLVEMQQFKPEENWFAGLGRGSPEVFSLYIGGLVFLVTVCLTGGEEAGAAALLSSALEFKVFVGPIY